MKKVLITGGCGFIGSSMVRQLLANRSHHVINVDCLTYAGTLENLTELPHSDLYDFYPFDITNESNIRGLILSLKPDIVINMAAESHVDRSITEPLRFVQTNVMGTATVLNAAKILHDEGHQIRFVQVSTDEVYGFLRECDPPFTEDSQISPSSPYSASKAAADHLVLSYHKTFGMDAIVTRSSNNYGPRQFPEKLIPLMLYKAKRGQKMPVYGDGLQIRDWIHVSDNCRGIMAAIENGKAGNVYNLGGQCERTNISIVEDILDVLETPVSLIEHVMDRPGHDFRYAMDVSKATKELDWNPIVDFTAGLRNTIKWYNENAEWVEKALSRTR